MSFPAGNIEKAIHLIRDIECIQRCSPALARFDFICRLNAKMGGSVCGAPPARTRVAVTHSIVMLAAKVGHCAAAKSDETYLLTYSMTLFILW